MRKPVILGADGRPMRQAVLGSVTRRSGASAFRGADASSASLADWGATLQSADGAHRFARDPMVARARDLVRNSPIPRSAVNVSVSRGVGKGWRLRSKPDHEILGITFEEAVSLGNAIERNWWRWGNDVNRRCDLQGKRTWATLQRLLWRQRKVDGENLAILRWQEAPGARFATRVQVVSTDRLMNRHRAMDTALLRQGVHLNTDGAPIAYDILNHHPRDHYPGQLDEWITVPKATPAGRPIVVHGFEDEDADQTRGVTPFAPILELFRLTDRYMLAEVQAAIIGGVLGAFIKSGFDPATVAESLGSPAGLADQVKGWQDIRMDYYEGQPVTLGDARLPVLPPGDEIELTNATRDTGPYADFVKTSFQLTAAALSEAYPEMAQNWEGVTYSSARTAYNSVWARVVVERAEFEDDTVFPIFHAVTDEGFDRGYIEEPPGAPSFEEAPEAYLASDWIGPGREHVDPVKGIQAAQLALDANLTTLEEEAARTGLDWEDLLEQRAREKRKKAELGLTEHDTAAALEVVAPTDEEASRNPAA
jgi:lambda family phage portal protein